MCRITVGDENDRDCQVDPQVTDPHLREYSPHWADHRLGDAIRNLPDPGEAAAAGSQHCCPVQHGSTIRTYPLREIFFGGHLRIWHLVESASLLHRATWTSWA